MPTAMANIANFLNETSFRFLHLLKYSVPQNQRNQNVIKAAFSYFVPTVIAVLSFCMLEIAMIVFISNLVGLIYKFLTSVFSYQSYKKNYERTTSVAKSLHETPLLIKTVVFLVLIVVIFIIFVLAIVIPKSVSFDGVWAICACIDITGTWFFDVVDSLVSVYGAEINDAVET